MSYRYMSREVFFRFIRDLPGWSSLDTVANLGQGELRGKVHLSRRCLAVSARNAHRLRRGGSRVAKGRTKVHYDANYAAFRGTPPVPIPAKIHLIQANPG